MIYISITYIRLEVTNLPIIRKLIKFNTSKAICLPKSWLENAESDTGRKIVAVALEVDGSITITPIFEKKTEGDKPRETIMSPA